MLTTKVYEVDPLVGPNGSGRRRMIRCMEDAAGIERLLRPRGRWPGPARAPRAPPRAASQITLDYRVADDPASDDELPIGHPRRGGRRRYGSVHRPGKKPTGRLRAPAVSARSAPPGARSGPDPAGPPRDVKNFWRHRGFLWLFALEFDKLPPWEKIRSPIYLSITGMANINRTKLYYEISGQGPPLVLLHAGSMDSRMWDEQFQWFAEYFKVIRYDVRGVGKSEMPTEPFSLYEDLYELLRFLNIDKAFLLGLSLGGRIAVDFSIAHPQMVKALVLAGAGLSGYVFSQPYIEKILAVISAIKDGSIARPGAASLSDSFLALSPGHVTARKQIIQMLTENVQAFSIDPSLMQELNPPAIGRLSEIRTPTLIIVGDHDCPDVQAMADLLAADIAGAKKVVMAEAGHIINLEQPEAFNKVVLDFLNRLPPSQSAQPVRPGSGRSRDHA